MAAKSEFYCIQTGGSISAALVIYLEHMAMAGGRRIKSAPWAPILIRPPPHPMCAGAASSEARMLSCDCKQGAREGRSGRRIA